MNYMDQENYEKAEVPLKRAIAILSKSVGESNYDLAQIRFNMGTTYAKLNRFAEAEPLMISSLEISEMTLPADHLVVSTILTDLADVYRARAKYPEAERHYKRALAILEKSQGLEEDQVEVLSNLAKVYRGLGPARELLLDSPVGLGVRLQHLQTGTSSHHVMGECENDPAGVTVVGDFVARAVPQNATDFGAIRAVGQQSISVRPMPTIILVGHRRVVAGPHHAQRPRGG